MIFDRVCVICDDFGDYHDKIVVTSIDFIGRRPICGHYLQGEGSFWEPPTKTTTPGQRSHRRWSRRGNQVLKRWVLRHVQCFGVGHRIWHKDCILASTFDGSHWGRKRWKNLDRILCILYFRFFHV
ncbi:hypothetical protein PVAP13_1NG352600 [Panicum virgatum]|uniref:Uncharacterized protein n=1 Tax=Panicum virgatum TaxID=38727 RepID=A0A8T0XAA9_PANVG|nr:hypothetical protein PVAP13_1NG352600 [Panicum virgatum]